MVPNWDYLCKIVTGFAQYGSHLGALVQNSQKVCTVWIPFGSTCANEAKPEGSRDPPGLTRGEEEGEQVLDGRGQGTVL